MKKCILAVLLIGCCGCTTAPVVYENINVARVGGETTKNTCMAFLEAIKSNTLEQARAIQVQQMEIQERWERYSKALYRIIAYLDYGRYIQYAATVAPGFGSDELTEIINKLASSVPMNINEDMLTVKIEEQAIYDFTVKLLNKVAILTQEDFDTNMDLIKRVHKAHALTQESLELLAEYLDSTEYIKREEALALLQQFRELYSTYKEGS